MISRIEELALIARCIAADDRQAFGRLVEEFQDGLRRFLFGLTMGDAALTDDLAQETFLKAYVSIRSFRGIARFKTWLYRIACNEYHAYMRRCHLSVEEPESSDDMEEVHAMIDMRHDIEVGLRQLSATERSIVLLFYIEDRPLKEISHILSMPEGTVRVYLSRSRRKLAAALKEEL